MSESEIIKLETVEEFAFRNKIGIWSNKIFFRPNLTNWAKDASHYEVVLKLGCAYESIEFARERGFTIFNNFELTDTNVFTTYFTIGSAIKGPPKIIDVLDCLASNAQSLSNSLNFNEWADNYGFSNDSIKAKNTYDEVVEQNLKLKHWLGAKEYQKLLIIERL
jgi:hypothetical protein